MDFDFVEMKVGDGADLKTTNAAQKLQWKETKMKKKYFLYKLLYVHIIHFSYDLFMYCLNFIKEFFHENFIGRFLCRI